MKLHDLAPPKGATKAKQRVGRGTGGKGHKTAGRGTKGQHARNTVPAGFEGGQLPLMQRIPKLKGFTNPFRIVYTPVNIGVLAGLEGDEFTVADNGRRRIVPAEGSGQGSRAGCAVAPDPGHRPRLLGFGRRRNHHGGR